jgi:hypothetical protein
MPLSLSPEPTPELDYSLSAALADLGATQKYTATLSAFSRAAAVSLASRVEPPAEGLARFLGGRGGKADKRDLSPVDAFLADALADSSGAVGGEDGAQRSALNAEALSPLTSALKARLPISSPTRR